MAVKKKSAKKVATKKAKPGVTRMLDIPVRKPGETRRRIVNVQVRETQDSEGNSFIVGQVVGTVTPTFAYGVKDIDVDAYRSAAEAFAEQTAHCYGSPGGARFE